MKLIPLSQCSKRKNYLLNMFAQVDDEDYEKISQHKWFLHKGNTTFYAGTNIYVGDKQRTVRMHRFILGVTNPLIEVDHKDRNGLNNQRSNIRMGTKSDNQKNRRSSGVSKYLGVALRNSVSDNVILKWRANIRVNKKQIYLGKFLTEEEAAIAYNKAALKYHGEFARLNVIMLPPAVEQLVEVD